MTSDPLSYFERVDAQGRVSGWSCNAGGTPLPVTVLVNGAVAATPQADRDEFRSGPDLGGRRGRFEVQLRLDPGDRIEVLDAATGRPLPGGVRRVVDPSWRPRIAIATPAKDEAPYLLEWIAYHRALGVDTFLIGDNGGADETSSLLRSLEQAGFIQRTDWRDATVFQLDFDQDAVERLCGLVDVCSITDVDEFLRPLNGRTDIPSAIAEIFARPDVSAAAINWAIFGSSGQLEPNGNLVIERFARRGEDDHDLHRTVKAIIRPERLVDMANPHVATITNGLYVNDCGDPVVWGEAARTEAKSWNSLRVDHYSIKSRMEFITKVRKGRPEALPGVDDRGDAFFAHHDRNEVVDPMPADFVERTKVELERLRRELKLRFPLGQGYRRGVRASLDHARPEMRDAAEAQPAAPTHGAQATAADPKTADGRGNGSSRSSLLRILISRLKTRRRQWSEIRVLNVSGYFDRDWYLRRYPDVAKLGIDPARHYLRHGAVERRNPGPNFDTDWYLNEYPDVAADGSNPLVHYEQHGRVEGRYPSSPSGESIYSRQNYRRWISSYDTLTGADRAVFRRALDRFTVRPVISVVMPVYQTDERFLRRAIDSVVKQIYPDWQLCISDDASTLPHVRQVLDDYQRKDARIRVIYRQENGHISANSNSALSIATGEFVALLDADDELPEQALFWVASEIARHPDADLIFSDEDKLDVDGARFDPYFKPDWNPALMLAQNAFSHLGVFRRSLVEGVGGFRLGFEGSQDHDLALRCAERTTPERIRHIPRILYHWRAEEGSTASLAGIKMKPYAREAGARAIREHLARIGTPGAVEPVLDQFYQVDYQAPEPLPKVSIVIPTAFGRKLVQQCLGSVLRHTTYGSFEILLAVSEKTRAAPECAAYLRELDGDPRIRVLTYPDQPFNYSAVNNWAVRQATGSVVCLLNDDVEIITPDWLERLVARVRLPGVGAVGCLLHYPNDIIQHAGVILGLSGVAGHAYIKHPRGVRGYFGRAALEQDLSCVTAACMALRREAFEAIGCFDERLAIAFNDVDLCIRLRQAGWRIVWTPTVELYHHESASTGRHDALERIEQFQSEVALMRRLWGETLDRDPFYNPNLSLIAGYDLAFPPRIAKLPDAG